MVFLVLIDGGEEYKENVSIFDRANMPVLEKIKKHGYRGKIEFFPEGFEADSLTCILTMLGVKPQKIPTSRASLEAVAAGIKMLDTDYIMRCNVVSVCDNRLKSFNGMGLNSAQMKDFALKASSFLPKGVELFHLSEYRNLLRFKYDMLGNEIISQPPPQESIGQEIKLLFKGVYRSKMLSSIIEDSSRIMDGYMLYPWGLSKNVQLPTFADMAGIRCGCVCKTEIMCGIAKKMGIKTIVPPDATADFDTNLTEKLNSAKELADICDMVIIHINGADELAHRRDYKGKLSFIEKIDEIVLGGLLSEMKCNFRLVVTSDHVTNSATGRHESEEVNWFCTDYKYHLGQMGCPHFDGTPKWFDVIGMRGEK
jgi:2,3-bisphosphoglycerate-independent phosphoglycerate mutase